MDENKKIELFKILSSPTRYRLIKSLIKSEGDNVCVSDLAGKLGASSSAISHQLSELEEKGIVSSVKEGKKSCYYLLGSPTTKKIKALIKVVS